MGLTMADWWHITKAAYWLSAISENCLAIYSRDTGVYSVAWIDVAEVNVWVEEMEYEYGDMSEIFD